MAVVMFVFVGQLANTAMEYEVKNELYKQLNRCKKQICVKDGQLIFDDDYETESDGILVLIFDRKTGRLVSGDCPDGFPVEKLAEKKAGFQIKSGKEVYYLKRLPLEGGRYVMGAVVERRQVSSHYQSIARLAYLCVLAVFGATDLAGVFLAKRLSDSLRGMCRMAERIGTERNMFRRMEYGGPFYELQVLTQANNRMLARLEEDFRQQEQFTSDVAHELRTPVAVMLAECQYAHGKQVGIEDYQEAVEVLERQAHKLDEIIAKLLALSRLDRGRFTIQQDDVDLKEIAESVCEDVQLKYGARVEIRQELEEVHTTGDIGLIMMAVQNILGNAAKFSREGGVIEVRTGSTEDGIYVAVRDYGVGMTEEEQAHIFERFYKADKSRNSEGYGLGLSLTKKIMQEHGGDVSVQSSPGEGSLFELRLPLTKNKDRNF